MVSATLFGFLAVLIARETHPNWRWLPYLIATLLVIAIAFSRLYLGLHWLTDTLAGLSLGLIWVTLLGLAYNRHSARHVERPGLIVVSLTLFIAASLLQTRLYHDEELLYDPAQIDITTMTHRQWWQEGWRQLPAYRTDFRGEPRQALIIQWVAPLTELKQHLHAAGWQSPPPLTLTNALMWFNPQTQLTELPVLPRVHDGRHEDLSLIRMGNDPDSRWVLRLWAADVHLEDSDTPIWLGSLTRQGLEQRAGLLSIAADKPLSQSPDESLTPLLQRLSYRLASDPTDPWRPPAILINSP
jgi:undecaprenyl-diphosphatase